MQKPLVVHQDQAPWVQLDTHWPHLITQSTCYQLNLQRCHRMLSSYNHFQQWLITMANSPYNYLQLQHHGRNMCLNSGPKPRKGHTENSRIIQQLPSIGHTGNSRIIQQLPSIGHTGNSRIIQQLPSIGHTENSRIIQQLPSIGHTGNSRIIQQLPSIGHTENSRIIQQLRQFCENHRRK